MENINKNNKKNAVTDFKKVEYFTKFKNNEIIGHLKAAEAMDRIKSLKTRYQFLIDDEKKNFIEASERAAQELRLKAFLMPSKEESKNSDQMLTKRAKIRKQIEKRRIDALLNDDDCWLITRKLF